MQRLGVFIVAALLALSGAAGASDAADTAPDTSTTPDTAEPLPYQPVQFPMPPESSMDSSDTDVVGSNQTWYGTIRMSSSKGMDEVHQYYDVALPSQGWAPLSALMTSDKAVLQYVNRHLGRACIVTLTAKSLWRGTDIDVVVSPLINQSGRS